MQLEKHPIKWVISLIFILSLLSVSVSAEYICDNGGLFSLPVCFNISTSSGNGTGNITTNNYYNVTNTTIINNGSNLSFNETYTNGLYYPLITNPYAYYNVTTIPSFVLTGYLTTWGNNLNNISLSTIQTYINANGNWTADKSSYSTTSQANLLYAPLGTVGDNVSWNKTYADTLYDSFGRSYTNITSLQNNMGTIVTNLSSNSTILNNMINNINTTKLTTSDQRYNETLYIQSQFNGLNNISLSTIQTYINANGNWTADKTSYSTTTVANGLYDAFGRSYTNITSLQSNMGTVVTNLSSNSTILNDMINTLNVTVQAKVTDNISWNKTYADTLYDSFGRSYTNITSLQSNMGTIVTNLSSNSTMLNNMVNSLNSTSKTNETLLNNMINTLNSSTAKLNINNAFTGDQLFNNANFTGLVWINNVNSTNVTGFTSASQFFEGNVSLINKYATITALNSIGNWTADKTLYTTLAYLTTWGNGLNNISLSTIQTYINANGNWTADKSSYSTITVSNGLYDAFGRSYTNITSLQSNMGTIVTNLSSNSTMLNNMVNSLNSTSKTNETLLNNMINTLNSSRLTNESQLNIMINNLNSTKSNVTNTVVSGNLTITGNTVNNNATGYIYMGAIMVIKWNSTGICIGNTTFCN